MAIHELFPYLRVRNASQAIAFYKRVFGAVEKMRLSEPSGRVGHAELDFGGTILMLSDEYPELGFRGPQSVGAVTSSIHLHVDDADALIQRALEAGAELLRPPSDQFYGERSGTVRDPFGHEWMIGHNIEQLTPDEMQRRYDDLFAKGEAG
jgi:PhnB protein